MNNNKKLKVLVLSLMVAAGMLLPASSFAQQRGGGLFGQGELIESDEWSHAKGLNELGGGLFLRDALSPFSVNFGNEAFGATGSQINNEPFGAPIGSGIGILLAAGVGYALIQSKKNKQN